VREAVYIAKVQERVGFALGMVGHLVDHFGAWVVRRCNQKLVNAAVRMKGLIAVVAEMPPGRVIDPDGELGPEWDKMNRELTVLHQTAVKARDDLKLQKTHEAFRQAVELCVALREAISELNAVLVEHDRKAKMGDDARRLEADLRRTDDRPKGYYAEMGAALSKLPHAKRRAA
jgi:hypothetical protein